MKLNVCMICLLTCQIAFSKEPHKCVYDLPKHLARTVEIIQNPDDPYVLVEAHRGAWTQEIPENSIKAIQHAIELGVDWVEIDIRLTKDRQPVLMHDDTLDRTTTLNGKVTDYTLKEITSAKLKKDNGVVTDMSPPSLEEALEVMASKILFRIDLKSGKSDIEEVYSVIEQEGLLDQAILNPQLRDRALAYGFNDRQIIVRGDKIEDIEHPSKIDSFVDYVQIKDFDKSDPPIALMKKFASCLRMVASPYNDSRAGGHGDELSQVNPDAGWGWLIDSGADIMLTDEPGALINYLEKRQLRDRTWRIERVSQRVEQ